MPVIVGILATTRRRGDLALSGAFEFTQPSTGAVRSQAPTRETHPLCAAHFGSHSECVGVETLG